MDENRRWEGGREGGHTRTKSTIVHAGGGEIEGGEHLGKAELLGPAVQAGEREGGREGGGERG